MKVEIIVALQQAFNESVANCTLQDALKILADTSPCMPPRDYYELCTMLGPYAALLFALFGSGCEFFGAVFNLYNILLSDRVIDIKGCFTVGYCRQIMWGVIEEGHTFFGTQLHPWVLKAGYM
jgi:hypothetical protein